MARTVLTVDGRILLDVDSDGPWQQTTQEQMAALIHPTPGQQVQPWMEPALVCLKTPLLLRREVAVHVTTGRHGYTITTEHD